ESLRPTQLQGLPDRRRPEGLAGMDREVEVLAADLLEGVQVPRGRVAGFRAGDVEAAHTAIAPSHGELGDLEAPGGGSHRRQQRADGDASTLAALSESLHRGLDDLVEGEPSFQVELGSEPDLRVHDAVVVEVLGALAGYADESIARLHDADRVREGLEIQHEVLAAGAPGHPGAKLVRVVRRQLAVTGFLRQLDDRRRARAAIEMIV